MDAITTKLMSKKITLSTTLQIVSTAVLGVVILYGVGFLEMNIAHNAAHDTRHSAVFPCH